MKIRSLFIALCIFSGSSVYAQSYYEMLFYFDFKPEKDELNQKQPERTEFKSFLLLHGDGTGTMRLTFDEKGIRGEIFECTIKQKFYSNKENKIDYSTMYYMAKNFKSVNLGEDTHEELPPFMTFWFKVNPKTNEFEPWAVMLPKGDKGHENEYEQGVISRVRLLETKDLTKKLVADYYDEDDDIYKNLFETNIRALTPEEKKSKMYLLVVADIEDEQIGPDCQKDREKQTAYFKKIADKLEISFIPLELTGKELSRKNLLAKIDEIKATKNDIVIFHFSGHGYSKNDNRQYPYLDLRYDKDIPVNAADEINMEEVYALITGKPGRLNLVISDCCNWHLNMSNMQSANIANPRPSAVGLSLENIKALFMNPNRTSLLITAAQKGEVSAGNAVSGGIFSSQLREALQKFMGINYQHITWEQVTENVRTQTATVSGYSNCPRPENPQVIGACKQTPVYKIN